MLLVTDIDAKVWNLIICIVAIRFSEDELVTVMGIQRRVGVFPVMETKYKLFVEEVFCTFPGQDLVIVESLIRQNDILPLWYIMLLIFAYNIYPRRHT